MFQDFQLKQYPLTLLQYSNNRPLTENRSDISLYSPEVSDQLPIYATPKQQLHAIVLALLEGVQVRHKLRLYQGDQAYYADLQAVLNVAGEIAAKVLEEWHFAISRRQQRTGTIHHKWVLMIQCTHCGKHSELTRFCRDCLHTHYCSQACEVNHKLTHQRSHCQPRCKPNRDSPLLLEIHYGTDLGKEVTVYFQHQCRLSHQVRGNRYLKQFVLGLPTKIIDPPKKTVNIDPRGAIVASPSPNNLSATLICSPEAYLSVEGSIPFWPNFEATSVQSIESLYATNTALSVLIEKLIGSGCLIKQWLRECHNNHFHFVIILACP